VSALATAALPLRIHRPRIAVRLQPVQASVRPAGTENAAAIHALIEDHSSEGRLLPRSATEIAAHLDRFVVATVSGRLVGCVDLAPLSGGTAEIRSLVVAEHARSNGLGRRLLSAAIARAHHVGFDQLCAFTHSPSYFVQAGFSLVPHTWIPEKIGRDCRSCTSFGRCGQSALLLPLGRGTSRSVPHGSLND
jgi:N-acetylglutamate synthase-like GNAT family acetyltransferase